MIIVCPNCSTRYMIPDGSIGESGRKVRCNNCKELWTQHADDAHADDADDVQKAVDDFTLPAEGDTSFLDEVKNASSRNAGAQIAIPESIYPDKKDSSLDAIKDGLKQAKHWKNYISGVACGVIVLGLTIAVILTNARGIILSHNALRPVFAALGSDPFGYVEDVVFDNVVMAYQDETHSFIMDGQVINMKEHDVLLPAVKITFADEHYDTLDIWHAMLSNDTVLHGESSIAFSLEYPMATDLARQVRSVVIEFAEDGEGIAHDVDLKISAVHEDTDVSQGGHGEDHPPADEHLDHSPDHPSEHSSPDTHH